MSFDNINRKSYIYRDADERNQMRSNTFIQELKAFPAVPGQPPDFSSLNPETYSVAFLQAAFFQKYNETEQSKYFMIINRRCSPFINYNSPDNIGGRRLVTLRINPNNLPGFNNWKIFNLETGDTSLTFNKNDSQFVFIGDFMPGEGKLFKIAPVMQEGGTLVANEVINGVSFTCKDTVISNGKNIMFSGHSNTISFSDSGTIIMNNANFYAGDTLAGSSSQDKNGFKAL